MATAVARELMSVFVGFLSGDSHPSTKYGRFWEGALLGGNPEFFEDEDHVLGWRQAGIPYLIDENNRCHRVSRRWIANFARKSELVSTLTYKGSPS